MFSKSCFFERFDDFMGLRGDLAFGVVVDELFKLAAGLRLAFEFVETATVVEEDDVEEVRVGVV